MYFIDFGNKDVVPASSVRPCPPDLAAVAPQAQRASLAFIKAPGLDQEYGVEAAQLLSELVGGGRRLTAFIEKKERLASAPGGKASSGAKGWAATAASASASSTAGPMQLSLTVLVGDDDEEGAETVNEALVSAGLARVVEPGKNAKLVDGALDALEGVREKEQDAKRRHLGMWQYGDPGSEDEDEYPALGGGAAKRR